MRTTTEAGTSPPPAVRLDPPRIASDAGSAFTMAAFEVAVATNFSQAIGMSARSAFAAITGADAGDETTFGPDLAGEIIALALTAPDAQTLGALPLRSASFTDGRTDTAWPASRLLADPILATLSAPTLGGQLGRFLSVSADNLYAMTRTLIVRDAGETASATVILVWADDRRTSAVFSFGADQPPVSIGRPLSVSCDALAGAGIVARALDAPASVGSSIHYVQSLMAGVRRSGASVH